MSEHAGILKARRDLADLESMLNQSARMSKQILDAAVKRLEVVQTALAEAGAQARGNYQSLVDERGHLEQVIAAARAE